MARDRQRAKQRKARRAAQNPGPAPSEPHRANVPGELEHASGEVDEFDAALVAGAEGRPVDAEPDVDGEPRDRDELLDDEPVASGAEEEPRERGDLLEDEPRERGDLLEDEPVISGDDTGAEIYPDELEDDDEPYTGAYADADEDDEEDLDARDAGAGSAGRGRRRGGAVAAGHRAEAPSEGGPARFLAFLRASWAELQRVQWPDRRQVFQATAVVLGFVVIAGVYLGVADRIAQEVVDLII